MRRGFMARRSLLLENTERFVRQNFGGHWRCLTFNEKNSKYQTAKTTSRVDRITIFIIFNPINFFRFLFVYLFIIFFFFSVKRILINRIGYLNGILFRHHRGIVHFLFLFFFHICWLVWHWSRASIKQQYCRNSNDI